MRNAGDLPPHKREMPFPKGWGKRLEMGLVERFKAIFEGMPEGASVFPARGTQPHLAIQQCCARPEWGG
jgi:hypothetical protein